MTGLKYGLTAIYIIVCIAMIIIATIQTKESNGASAAITGSSTNNFYEKNKGRTKEGKLKRTTIILGIIFFISTVSLGIVYML